MVALDPAQLSPGGTALVCDLPVHGVGADCPAHRSLAAAGLAWELVREIYERFLQVADDRRAVRSGAARRRFGLGVPAARARLEAARNELAQLDEIKQVFVDWAEKDTSEKRVIHYGLDELATSVEDLSEQIN